MGLPLERVNSHLFSLSDPQSKSMKLYEVCLTLLQVYSKNNLGRKRADVAAEEDQYQDLLLIMELLTNLLSKEFIDFSDTGVCFHLQNQSTFLYDILGS